MLAHTHPPTQTHTDTHTPNYTTVKSKERRHVHMVERKGNGKNKLKQAFTIPISSHPIGKTN